MERTFNWWSVSVELETENDKGAIKKIKEEYLVKAVDPTDAQVQITKELGDSASTGQWCIKAQKQTKILRIIHPHDVDLND